MPKRPLNPWPGSARPTKISQNPYARPAGAPQLPKSPRAPKPPNFSIQGRAPFSVPMPGGSSALFPKRPKSRKARGR